MRDVESLKQRAAEAHVAYRAAEKAGDAEKSEKAWVAFEEAHAAHMAAKADAEKDEKRAEMERFYLDPLSRVVHKGRREGGGDGQEEFGRAVRLYLELGRQDERAALDVLVAGGMSQQAAAGHMARVRSLHRKAFVTYCTHPGEGNAYVGAAAEVLERGGIGPAEAHTMMVGDNERGGFLVPEDRRAEVLKDLPGSLVMRTLARVERTTGDSITWPTLVSATTEPTIRTSKLSTDQWSTEDADASVETSDDVFGESEIRVHDWQGKAVVATRKLLASVRDVENVILGLLFESFTADEDKKYIKGSGAGEPLGCLTDSRVTAVNSGHASTLLFDGFMTWLFTLPAQYAARATMLLKRMTLKHIMVMENPTTGEYVWDPTKTPDRIMGYPFAQSDFVDGVAASKYVALLGDFKFGYVIVESDQFRVLRLDQWKPPKIAFLPIAQVGGKIVRPAAFVRHYVHV